MQERHATWCADLVSRFDVDACGPHQGDWLRVLRLEQANLRAALEYFAASPEAAVAGLTMARGLDLYWSASGLLDEARHWLEVALSSGAGTPAQRATALAVAARFAVLQNDRVRARQLLEEGTELAGAVEDARALGLLLVPTAMLAVWDGTPAAAAAQADTAVTCCEPPPTSPASCWRSSSPGSVMASRVTATRPPTGTGSASPAPTRSANVT